MKGRMGSETKEELKERFYEQLRESKGFTTYACKAVPLDYATYMRWRREDLEFAKNVDDIVRECHEALNDFAESKLFKNIDDCKETSIIFYLKSRAKDRGYVERQEITGKDGESIFSRESLIAIAREIARDADEQS